jgi:tRNA U34 5-methylaminomethyl-2-thiouridine-forming methyltransferase MnmC
MLWAPESIRRVARVIGEIRKDLNFETSEYVETGLDRKYDEFEAESLGHFEPRMSQTRDPVFTAGVRALEPVLRDEISSAQERRRFIQQILNAVYPDGYRSPRNPLGSRKPKAPWSLRRVADVARLQRKQEPITEDEAQLRNTDTA